VGDQPLSVRRDFYGETAAIALHPQGDPPELGDWASTTRRIPAQSDETAPRLRPGRSSWCKIGAKEQRQIIVSTHNPNIVVGGDAEQVVVLDAEDGHRAGIDITGSIDDTDVIDAVLTVMEGGREAFETRSKRYGVR
jgi:hypothetical protein